MNGSLHIAEGKVVLSLSCWMNSQWMPLSLRQDQHGWTATYQGVNAWLAVESDGADSRYRLALKSETPNRLLLRLGVARAELPFHVIPGWIFGDNNLAFSRGHAPNLTTAYPED